jgi:uncharacterized protein (UPF0261 family)
MIDIGVLADETRAELAHAAGADISALALARDRGAALAIMSTGAKSVVTQLHRGGKLDGILGLGRPRRGCESVRQRKTISVSS